MQAKRVKPVSGILISRPEVLTADRTYRTEQKEAAIMYFFNQTDGRERAALFSGRQQRRDEGRRKKEREREREIGGRSSGSLEISLN